MEEKEFGHYIIDTYNLDVDFEPLYFSELKDGTKMCEFTVTRNGKSYTSNFLWGSRIDTNELDEGDVVYSIISDWAHYYIDPDEAFSMFESLDEWNKYQEEVNFVSSIFTESETNEIMDKYQNIY